MEKLLPRHQETRELVLKVNELVDAVKEIEQTIASIKLLNVIEETPRPKDEDELWRKLMQLKFGQLPIADWKDVANTALDEVKRVIEDKEVKTDLFKGWINKSILLNALDELR